MNPNLTHAAGAALAPSLLRRFKFSWVIYGAAAYYGLKFLNKRGIMPDQTGAALRLIDHGVDFAKGQLGLNRFGHSSGKGSSIQGQAQLPH